MSDRELVSTAAVSIRDLTFKYGKVTALDNVSIDIPPRKMVGLIGPDGVGKSTLLSLVTGARAMGTEGELYVLAGDMRSKNHREKICPKIAYSFSPVSSATMQKNAASV